MNNITRKVIVKKIMHLIETDENNFSAKWFNSSSLDSSIMHLPTRVLLFRDGDLHVNGSDIKRIGIFDRLKLIKFYEKIQKKG